jgi:hypothetical protein
VGHHDPVEGAIFCPVTGHANSNHNKSLKSGAPL